MKYTNRASSAILVAGLKGLYKKQTKTSPENILDALLSQYDSTAIKLLHYVGGHRNIIYSTLRSRSEQREKPFMQSDPEASTWTIQEQLDDFRLFIEQYHQQDLEKQPDFNNVTLNMLWLMADETLALASKEMQNFGHDVLGTEHLLIAVSKNGGLTQQILNDHGVYSDELSSKLNAILNGP